MKEGDLWMVVVAVSVIVMNLVGYLVGWFVNVFLSTHLERERLEISLFSGSQL